MGKGNRSGACHAAKQSRQSKRQTQTKRIRSCIKHPVRGRSLHTIVPRTVYASTMAAGNPRVWLTYNSQPERYSLEHAKQSSSAVVPVYCIVNARTFAVSLSVVLELDTRLPAVLRSWDTAVPYLQHELLRQAVSPFHHPSPSQSPSSPPPFNSRCPRYFDIL